MKKIFLLLLAIGIFISCSAERDPEYDLIISSINVIDGTGSPLQENVTIYIKDSLIVRIDTVDSKRNESNSVINGEGKYLIPGLIDGHTHPGIIRENFPKFIHYGVTGIFVTGCGNCSHEHYTEMRELSANDSIPSPKVYHTSQHFTMEGRHPVKTYGGDRWVNEETVFYLKDTTMIEDYVRRVSQHPIVGIKLTIEDGPAPPFVARMPQEFITKTVDEAKKYGLEVFAHVSDNTELEMAVKGGVQYLVHFTGVDINPQDSTQLMLLEQLKQRNASWVTTLMIDKSFLYPSHPEWFEVDEMLPDFKMVKDTLTSAAIERSRRYKSMLEEFYGAEEGGLSVFVIPQAEDIKFLRNLGINMVLGTDTGNDFNFPGYSLHEEMQLMEMGSFTPVEIIRMSTRNAADMLGILDKTGTIEIGKYADLVMLDENPLEDISNTLKINRVFKNGNVQTLIKPDE